MAVFKLDRLARDLIVQETLIAEVRKIGGQLFTTAAGEAAHLADDPDDPSRKLIRQVLGAVNEYERSMIVLWMKSGRKIKAAKGGYAGYGSPAFGQRSVDKELVADEREAAVARLT
jgi:DNA invertase Pin-like site-specific DNA recombinase